MSNEYVPIRNGNWYGVPYRSLVPLKAENLLIEGLVKAMDACSLDSGTIVTESQRDSLSVGNCRIKVVPFCEWELETNGAQGLFA